MGKAQMHGESEHEGKMWGAGKHANMPTDVKLDSYPKAHEMGPTVENDTMTRVDAENRQAHSQARKYMSNQH